LDRGAQIELPERLLPLFTPPRGAVRYRCAWGGRGSGKSYSFALMALVYGYAEPLRILATRELQVSIKESFHAELVEAVKSQPWLAAHYDCGENYLRGRNGTEFIFRGLRHNMSSIRSMAQIDLAIVEEAEDVPEASWRDLLPTVRAPKSEVWAIWNPRLDGSPVDQRFRKRPPADAQVAECHYWDNPWFPAVLDRQRRHDQEILDPQTYAHIWEGAYLTNSTAQVLAGKVRVAEFSVPADRAGWDGPYHGLDWGFSQDPTAAVRCWIRGDALHVEHEAGRIGLELDDTAPFLRAKIPGIERYMIRADSARPESISHVSRRGLQIVGAQKWKGSVEDGIGHLRSYREIVIHPRCAETIRETRLYSYKVDRLTGDVLPEVVDACNHYIDAIRYALAPLIKMPPSMGGGIKVPGL
jgi:phage terminase large subunit